MPWLSGQTWWSAASLRWWPNGWGFDYFYGFLGGGASQWDPVLAENQKIIGTPGIRLYNGTCMIHCVLSSATTATFFAGEITIMEK